MIDLIKLTWEEIKQLDKKKSIVFIVVAPIEEHGIHLPLGTDIYESQEWVSQCEEILAAKYPELQCFALPAFPIASASATDFYGCIHFKPKTTYKVMTELIGDVAKMGFNNICVVSGHADPVHQIALNKACKKVNKKYGVCAFSPLGAFFSADELQLDLHMPQELTQMEQKAPDDYHAGWIETSCILDIDSSLVKQNYREVPATMIKEKDIISKKKQVKAMGIYGHLGNPALANENLGKMLNTNTAEFMAEAVTAFINRENYEIYMYHSLYKIPFLHLCYYL